MTSDSWQPPYPDQELVWERTWYGWQLMHPRVVEGAFDAAGNLKIVYIHVGQVVHRDFDGRRRGGCAYQVRAYQLVWYARSLYQASRLVPRMREVANAAARDAFEATLAAETAQRLEGMRSPFWHKPGGSGHEHPIRRMERKLEAFQHVLRGVVAVRRYTGRAYAPIRWWGWHGRKRLTLREQSEHRAALRIALWLLRNDGCSWAELAQAFGASIMTVRRHVSEQDCVMCRRAGIPYRREYELLKTRLPNG